MKWIVSQIGARQHYAVPRGFSHVGRLRLFYTDLWCSTGRSLLRRGLGRLRALASRYHPDLSHQNVVAFNGRAITQDVIHSFSQRRDVASQYRHHIRVGEWFAGSVAQHLDRHLAQNPARQELNAQQHVFFGFNTGCLETLQLISRRAPGMVTIVDQIDPGPLEEELVIAEAERWPGWQTSPGRIPQEYWQRLRAEWQAASLILVNSNWSKEALAKHGVPAEKMFVVPVAYEAEDEPPVARQTEDGPITVLWLGTVNLRKGIQYLVEAARRLASNSAIRFEVVGPIQISQEAVASAPPNMRFRGRATRDEAEAIYRQASVFVLPTISDGFAVTQVEAMAQGLPVITTPHCGEVVTPGVDGLIVPAYDAVALADAIAALEADRSRLCAMSHAALIKSRQFKLEMQTRLIEEAVTRFQSSRGFHLRAGGEQPVNLAQGNGLP